MFTIILALLSNVLFAQNVSKRPMNLEEVTRAFLGSDLGICKKELPDCERLFDLTFYKTTNDISMKLKSAAVFGTLFEMADACHKSGKMACDLVEAILNDNKDECSKFNNTYSQLCTDVKNFRLNSCENVKDPFLSSVCLKKINPACQNDLVCLIAWSYVFRENVEILKIMRPEIRDALVKLYEEEKLLVKESQATLVYNKVPVQDLIKVPLFPSPLKMPIFSTPKKTNELNKSAVKKTLKFEALFTAKDAFLPSMRELLYPWRRGEGVTVADWDGDGYLDVFTVDGDNVVFFENVNGTEFRKFSINLVQFGLKGYLVDISVADIDGSGVPAIIVQSFPSKIHILRWIKEKSSFSTETVNLPNVSQTHAYVKFKSGIGLIFPGWNGIASAPNSEATDYIARVVDKKWTFEKIPNSDSPTLGVSVIEKSPTETIISISRDLEGGTSFYTIVGDDFVQLPDSGKLNYFAHSIAYLKKSKDEGIWITSGLGFNNGKDDRKRIGVAPPKFFDECKENWTGSEREFCIIRYVRSQINLWPTFCPLFKFPEAIKICEMQNEVTGIQNIKLKNRFDFKSQVFSNLKSPVIDNKASNLVSEMGQVWHMSPLKSPSMEGFLIGEARTNPTKPRKVWWLSFSKNGVEKVELTNSLGLKNPYDATQFALADLNRDGQLDIVFKSGRDMVFLKGDTGGDSSLEENLQSGHQSRTFIQIPANPKKN